MRKIFLTLILLMTWCFSFSKTHIDLRILHPNVDTLFLELPAQEYPLTAEGLPFYSSSLNIGKVSADTPVDVAIDYPEYVPLTRAEVKWAKQHQAQIGTQLKIDRHLAFSRKVGYLDLSFSPIIRKGDEYLRLVSCKIRVQLPNQTTNLLSASRNGAEETPERWKTSSVLKSGKWVKIRVKKEGIYALTPAFLSKMGFSSPSQVKLFGYGGRMLEENWTFDNDRQVPDDLNEIPLFRKENGEALFFAEGTVRWTYQSDQRKWIHENNPYSKYSYYFITEGEQPATFSTIKAEKTALRTLSTVDHYVVEDHDAFGWYHGGREMYDDNDLAHGTSNTYRLTAPSIDTEATQGTVDISISASNSLSPTTVAVAHNDQKLGNLNIPKYSSFQSAYEVRRKFPTQVTTDNTFQFNVSPSNPSRLNFIRINYQRKLKASDPAFSFSPNTASAVNLQIEAAHSNTRLWRIGYHGHPCGEIESTFDNGVLSATVDEGKQRYVIVDLNKSYPTPEWDQKVENQDLHGDLNAYDMVILLPESRKFAGEAQRLAEAHQSRQGLRVKIVDAGQIYNEFSSGTPDATAYRRYLKMLYDRAETDQDLPRYLLLFGNSLWDNRMLAAENSSLSPKDYLLCFEVTEGFKNPNNTTFPLGEQNSYVTDDYFGWLDDSEGDNYALNKIDLGIGRFPCSDLATAKTLVDKSIRYMENRNTGAWKNTIYVLADNGNANLHMNDAEVVVEQIKKSTKNSSVIKKMYIDAYTRVTTGTGYTFPTVTKIMQEALHQGALIFNYTGHGNPDQLSHTRILTTPDFEVPNAGNLPLWIMASCEISPYDSKRKDIGRVAVCNPNGGAIAVMCASRAVYSNYNRILNVAYNKYLFDFDSNGKKYTMGDALRLTKVELVTPSSFGGIKDGSINKLKYLLIGNPALAVATPTGNVVLDSINGQSISTAGPTPLKAGSLVRFSGHLTDVQQNELPDYQGVLTATMMDRLEAITCKNNDGTADEPMIYHEHTKKIFEGSDSVRNGKFSFSFRIPKDISYTNDLGRITFYAINNESNLECHGYNEQFYLNGTDASAAPDSLGPKIYLYLNHPDFPDGGVCSPDPVFFAKISDDAGINATGIGIGHDIELVIDNQITFPISLNEYFKYDFGSYSQGTLSYPLHDLEPGKHTLSLRVWDVNGNSTTASLTFYIQEDVSENFSVYATENPAKTSTTFVTVCPTTDENPMTAVFEVFSLSGQKVWESHKVELPVNTGYGVAPWNLTTTDGARLPADIYLYKVKVSSATQKKESKAKKMILLEK